MNSRSVPGSALAILIMGLLSACTTVQTPERGARASPSRTRAEGDVDAQFEARFRDNEVHLARGAVPAAAGLAGGAGSVEFHVFSLGQADSMLVIGPGPAHKTLLIDVGETGWNSQRSCKLVRERIKALTGHYHVDDLVLTHYHLDHAGYPRTEDAQGRISGGGGLFCLLDGGSSFFTVGRLIDPGDDEGHFLPTRPKLHEAIVASASTWISSGSLQQRLTANFTPDLINLGPGTKVEIVSVGGRVFDGDAGALTAAEQGTPNLYHPGSEASPNDFSVGLEISVGDFELFTAGDLTGAPGTAPYPAFTRNEFNQIYTNVESHMLRHWQSIGRESDVEVYRANHHGSGNSSTTDLVNALQPELVIYSVGSRYGHPTRDIAERFRQLGADQMVTTQVDDPPWGNELFPAVYGNGWNNPVGDITITVPLSGSHYTVETADQAFEYPIYTDQQEAN